MATNLSPLRDGMPGLQIKEFRLVDNSGRWVHMMDCGDNAANADDAPGTQPFCSLEEPGDAGAVEEGRRTT